jgi:hypothetical protein
VASSARASADRDRDGLLVKTAGDEGQGPGRGLVEPLRVVDHTDQRPLAGRPGQQAEGGQADQEAVRRGADLAAE